MAESESAQQEGADTASANDQSPSNKNKKDDPSLSTTEKGETVSPEAASNAADAGGVKRSGEDDEATQLSKKTKTETSPSSSDKGSAVQVATTPGGATNDTNRETNGSNKNESFSNPQPSPHAGTAGTHHGGPPETPGNQPIGGGGPQSHQQQQPGSGMGIASQQIQQHAMGYGPPPPGHPAAGGGGAPGGGHPQSQPPPHMMYGQYPHSMAYNPYGPPGGPHGYPGQHPSHMMMTMPPHPPAPGPPGQQPGGTMPPGNEAPMGGGAPNQGQPPSQQIVPGGQPPPQQPGQPPLAPAVNNGGYGQPPHPPGGDGSQQQQQPGVIAPNNGDPATQGNQRGGPPPPGHGQYPPPGMMMGGQQQPPGQMQMQYMMQYGAHPGMYYPMSGAMPYYNPAMMGGGGKPPQAYMQAPPPPRSAGIPIALSCDDEQLSEYQMLVRKQLEIFEAQAEDVDSNTQGRKKQVTLGQVGIRCKHCAGFPLRQRGRGAVYYPAKLNGVYQASQNMASSHLCESCQCIPPGLKSELRGLRDRRDTASGGKQYWADGARAMGLYETDDGLRLRRPEQAPAAQSPS